VVSAVSVHGGLALELAQNILVEEAWWRKLFTSWWTGSRRTEKGQRQDTTLKNMPPVTYFLQLGPAFQTFQNIPNSMTS
jgi:hypothetical protein